jgi:aminoglycoside phosphotransferase (APT) family kinase protein
VEVPNYKFVWLGNKKHPQKIAGYRKITGIPLTTEIFDKKWTRQLGEDIGRFITQLHSLRPPPRILASMRRYTLKSWKEAEPKYYRQARKLVYPLLDAGTRARAEAFWNRYLEHFSKTDFEPTLVHSDLTGGNIILDPSGGVLRGVIDWGWVMVGDPALDFMGSFEVNRELGERALESYQLEKNGFRERIDLYLQSSTSGETAYGVRTNTDRFTREGLRHIQQRVVSNPLNGVATEAR